MDKISSCGFLVFASAFGFGWFGITGSALGVGMGILSAGVGVLTLVEKDEVRDIIEGCGIQTKNGHMPTYTKKDIDTGYSLTFKMPAGICSEDFIKHERRFSENLDGKIEFAYIGQSKLLLNVHTEKLEKMYNYELIESEGLNFAIGETRQGTAWLSFDDSTPHCLVGGTTGSGKSVCLRTIITTAILSKDAALHLCDLKAGAEFSVFRRSSKVSTYATNAEECFNLMHELKEEMMKRLDLFRQKEVENLEQYNRKTHDKLRSHLVVIDEFANLRRSKQTLELVDELLRMARAVGIHIIIATQRPSRENLPGTLKCNIQSIIAFKVKDAINSRILLENDKAALLRGKGHGILQTENDTEFQGYFISTEDTKELIKHTYKSKNEKENKPKGWIEIDPKE